jgi:phosphoglucosamine mutase
MRKIFGTDGIRGRANSEPMTAETALKVAMATIVELRDGDHHHRVIIGKDTRLSGYMIEQALTAGFLSLGADVILVGPLPTPAIAMLTRALRADLGVMVSASHNPFEDNGIKLFGKDGYKLSDEIEAAIEARMEKPFAPDLAGASHLGKAARLEDAAGRYVEHVKNTFPRGLTLEGMKIVVDCANGAAYKVAPQVLWELGAEVIKIGVEPNGLNINDGCGAMHPEAVQEAVIMHGADLGISLDGDADRVIIADEHGARIDGDQIMALIAQSHAEEGTLDGGGVVATVMSNLGFERHLADRGITVLRAPVGDRYVVETMRRVGYTMGGEQSGHIVLGHHSTTGDGLIAALQVLAALCRTDKPASEVCRVFTAMPQILRNVRYGEGDPLEAPTVRAAIALAETRLGARGRVLVRKSGTERLIRIMAEGEATDLVAEMTATIAAAIEQVAPAPTTLAAE